MVLRCRTFLTEINLAYEEAFLPGNLHWIAG